MSCLFKNEHEIEIYSEHLTEVFKNYAPARCREYLFLCNGASFLACKPLGEPKSEQINFNQYTSKKAVDEILARCAHTKTRKDISYQHVQKWVHSGEMINDTSFEAEYYVPGFLLGHEINRDVLRRLFPETIRDEYIQIANVDVSDMQGGKTCKNMVAFYGENWVAGIVPLIPGSITEPEKHIYEFPLINKLDKPLGLNYNWQLYHDYPDWMAKKIGLAKDELQKPILRR